MESTSASASTAAKKKIGKHSSPAPKQYLRSKKPSQGSGEPPSKVWVVKEPSQASSKPTVKEKTRLPSKNSYKPSSLKAAQVKETVEPSKADSSRSSSKVHQVKKTTQKPLKHPTTSSSKRDANVVHEIKWDGSDELMYNEPIGQMCERCEKDLAYPPIPSEYELEVHNFADVAILPCGHVFHTQCLEMRMGMLEEQLKDPSCFLCLLKESRRAWRES